MTVSSDLPARRTHERVLSLLPEGFAMEVVMRMLRMETVQKEALDGVERTLKAEYMSNLARAQRRDAHEMMAEIFNNLDRQSRPTSRSSPLTVADRPAARHRPASPAPTVSSHPRKVSAFVMCAIDVDPIVPTLRSGLVSSGPAGQQKCKPDRAGVGPDEPSTHTTFSRVLRDAGNLFNQALTVTVPHDLGKE